jgi:hypothetical protein
MEDQVAKAAMPTKEETPTETEARLRAQVVATRENSIEDSLMQVDLNVRPQSYLLCRRPTLFLVVKTVASYPTAMDRCCITGPTTACKSSDGVSVVLAD